MNLFEFLYKIPFTIAWKLANVKNYSFPIIFYCAKYEDFEQFESIRKNLPELSIVAGNLKLQDQLLGKGISSIVEPVYPSVIITIQDSSHKFPLKNILKIRLQNNNKHKSKILKYDNYEGYNLFLEGQIMDKKNSERIAEMIHKFVIDCGISF